MKANGIIVKKVEVIRETLRELRRIKSPTTGKLDKDYFLKRGVERSLQICVEAVIDIAHRIIALKNLPPCSTATKALEALEEMGILKDASAYKKMVQFRNFVVHRYETIETAILVGILRGDLGDFDRFIAEVLEHENDQL